MSVCASFRLAVCGVALLAATELNAQIASKSPFMPPQSAAGGAPTPGAPLEFRGYMETSEGIRFRLYDPAKKTGIWIKLNEKNPEFDVVVKQHEGGQLTVEHQGKTLTLAERESKVVSSGSAAQAMPPPVAIPATAPATNVSPAVTQTVVLNPTPADEQKRLDAVAAEVARRRAMREQAAQQLNTAGTPQPVLPQPIPGQAVQQQPVNQPSPQNTYQAPAVNPRGRGPMQPPQGQR